MIDNMAPDSKKHIMLHLVSDATGSTLQGLARACMAQFDGIHAHEKFWPLVRSEKQLERIIADIRIHPGPVFFTFVNQDMRKQLQRACEDIGVPCIPVLDPLIKVMSAYTGTPAKGIPGLQHALDEDYFSRVDAVDFALSFDDGQNFDGIEDADIVLVGVSRTSKTPTCIYLARRGIKAANIPFVLHAPPPQSITSLTEPLFVGLTESPERLVQLRKSRLRHEQDSLPAHVTAENTYLDLEKVEEEVKIARRFFSKHNWPVIDVTRRSVEETAAEIQVLLQRHKEKLYGSDELPENMSHNKAYNNKGNKKHG